MTSNFELKVAYEIGHNAALESLSAQEKVAFFSALANAGAAIAKVAPGWASAASKAKSGGKWLLGMGEGSAASNTIGMATGSGLLGAGFAEEGLENKLKGFAGGFGSGLLFAGAMPLASRFKGLNRNFSNTSKNFGQPVRDQAKLLDSQRKAVTDLEKTLAKEKGFFKAKGNKATEDALTKNKELLEEQMKSYKELVKSDTTMTGAGKFFNSVGGTLQRNKGTVTGLAATMVPAFYMDSVIQGEMRSRQRPKLPYTNNVFNPVSYGG